MNFSELDQLIKRLERTKLHKDSPPEWVNGKLVLWRTIRGFRTMLELRPGAGRYNFDGKSYKGGKVLIGPPSLAGKNIGEVDSKTWQALSGSGTKKSFEGKDDVSSLRTSVLNSLGDDDTRRGPVADATKAELIQIARSAGFTDDEIEQSLDGKVFEDGFGGERPKDLPKTEDKKDEKPKDEDKGGDVVPFKKPTKDGDEVEQDDREQNVILLNNASVISAGKDDKFTPPSKIAVNEDGNNPITEALTVPGVVTSDKKKEAADRLLELAKKQKGEFFRKQLEGYAYALHNGDMKLEEVKQALSQLVSHRSDAAKKVFSEKAVDKVHDKFQAKKAIEEMQAKIKEIEADRDMKARAADEAQRKYILERLDRLQEDVRSAPVVERIEQIKTEIRKKRLGGNSAILRILQILRFLLAFIPG